ncbi:MAG: hypothetical protein HFE30_01655 [Clostridiales bacterium]|nr:hypothetical protein [Clostridiales bacterium]
MNKNNRKTLSKKKKIVIISSIVMLAAIAVFLIFFLRGRDSLLTAVPAVTIETPDRKSASDREPFSLELQLSALGDEVYPAASFSISFDSSKLEFLGIEEGNVMITDAQSAFGYQLPEWSVNIERSNEVGQINLMYLDMTGGKYAFTKDALEENGNILLHLMFRLRGSAKSGDIYELSFDDAVFAASDEESSLASAKDALKTNNGRIVIGG